MAAYYNEFDPKAAAMLRQLISEGIIADGEVDERSITEVHPHEIAGFTQYHFFAGIGGWSVALRLAGWDDSRPVWTGSCPCQPFSSAGKQKGHSDERHLWPHWYRLIREYSPAALFGEQVASAIAYGWWDDVAADLEAESYACASAVLPACSVGRPHKRDRLWFVADRNGGGRQSLPIGEQHGEKHHLESCGTVGDSEHDGWHGRQERGGDVWSIQQGSQGAHSAEQPSRAGQPLDVADAFITGLEGFAGYDCTAQGWQGQARPVAQGDSIRWVECPDGKVRPVEPSIRLLVDGFPYRAPILHGFGNAIVPQVAAEFIKAYMGIVS